MPISAKVLLDSISESGQRVTTFALEYPKSIHPVVLGHKELSVSSGIGAVAEEDALMQVWGEIAAPIHWGSNQPGTEASVSIPTLYLDRTEEVTPVKAWEAACFEVTNYAQGFRDAGYPKLVVNRLLEPFTFIHTLVTSTSFDRFFGVSLRPDAQPEIRELARQMKEALDDSTPNVLEAGEWHLPLLTDHDERVLYDDPRGGPGNEGLWWMAKTLRQISVARCARVSYGANGHATPRSVDEDVMLYQQLLTGGDTSSFEHQLSPMPFIRATDFTPEELSYLGGWPTGVTHCDRQGRLWSNTSLGWIQLRQMLAI